MKTQAIMLILFTACGSITNPAGPEYPSDQKPKNGYEYCQMISDSARVHASHASTWGYVLSAFGAIVSTAGTAYPLAKGDDLKFKGKLGSAVTVASGAILYLLGEAVLKRSDAASKLAGETVAVLGERTDENGKKVKISPEEAGQKCSTALGAWETSRADATALASKLLENKNSEVKESQAKAAAANDKATKAQEEAKAKDNKLNEVRELIKQCPLLKCSDQQLLDVQQKLSE